MRLAAVVLALSAVVSAQPAEPRWRTLNRVAREAVQASDFAKLHAALLELKPLMPGNPRITYNLAAASARLGRTKEALEHLGNLAAMGQVFDIAADEDFRTLRDTPEFAQVVQRMAIAKTRVSRSQPAFTLAERDLIPEDVAYDAKTRRFFISSVRLRKIITADGRTFATSDWPVLALAIDARRRWLWASTGYVPQCHGCDAADKDKSALLCFELDSGKLLLRVDSPVPGLLGDMTISRHGDLYVSEGQRGAIFHFHPETSQWQRLDSPGEFPSPQTPALSADEKTLYVPDYLRGIAAINLASRAVSWLQPASGIALNGIDGLYLHRGWFLAVQNGSRPARLVRFSLDLRRQEVLEANTAELGEPTHGVILNGDFYFLANTGWDTYDAKGAKKADAAPTESTVRMLVIRD